MAIDQLWQNSDDDFDANAYLDEFLPVICEGKELHRDNWTITADIDYANDSVTIHAASK